jgi:hypothetical protein
MTVKKSGSKLNASSFFGGVIWMIWTGHTDILVLPQVLTSLAYHLFSLRFELVFFSCEASQAWQFANSFEVCLYTYIAVLIYRTQEG